MSELELWLCFVLIALATIVTRSGLLLAGRGLVIPPRVESALRYAPACALSAIIAPDLLLADGQLQLGLGNPRLLAGFAGNRHFLAHSQHDRHHLWRNGGVLAGEVRASAVATVHDTRHGARAAAGTNLRADPTRRQAARATREYSC